MHFYEPSVTDDLNSRDGLCFAFILQVFVLLILGPVFAHFALLIDYRYSSVLHFAVSFIADSGLGRGGILFYILFYLQAWLISSRFFEPHRHELPKPRRHAAT